MSNGQRVTTQDQETQGKVAGITNETSGTGSFRRSARTTIINKICTTPLHLLQRHPMFFKPCSCRSVDQQKQLQETIKM